MVCSKIIVDKNRSLLSAEKSYKHLKINEKLPNETFFWFLFFGRISDFNEAISEITTISKRGNFCRFMMRS